jgi:hypothetical protein
MIPAAFASCRVTETSVAHSQQTHDYDRLEIIYQTHPATGPLFSSVHPPAVTSPDVLLAAAEIPAVPDQIQNISWSKAELRIECPHPDGRADYALVTLHFRPVDCGQECKRASWIEQAGQRAELRQSRRTTFRERLFYETPPPVRNGESYFEMDLPKSELDAILTEISSHGFLSEHGRTSGTASHLEIRLNRRWTSKCWDYEPTLDALTTRVSEEGMLKTAFADGSATGSIGGGTSAWFKPFGHSR